MKTIKLNEFGTTLGSRDLGEKVREYILKQLDEHDEIISLSFEQITMISSSFADECFGKLIINTGVEKFKKSFKVTQLNDKYLKLVINRSVNQRIRQELLK